MDRLSGVRLRLLAALGVLLLGGVGALFAISSANAGRSDEPARLTVAEDAKPLNYRIDQSSEAALVQATTVPAGHLPESYQPTAMPVRLPEVVADQRSVGSSSAGIIEESSDAIPSATLKMPSQQRPRVVRLPEVPADVSVSGEGPALFGPHLVPDSFEGQHPDKVEAADDAPATDLPEQSSPSLSEDAPQAAFQPLPVPRLVDASSQSGTQAPRPDAAMRVVSERAAKHVRRGITLGDRGAYYSARSEFIRALRLISQALDEREGGTVHSKALAAGLRALDESDDFLPQGSRLEANLDLSVMIPAHETPVLKSIPGDQLTPLMARRSYYNFAQEQLAAAVGHERAGSMALYGMARVQSALVGENASRHTSAEPKAMVLHQAALLVDSDNYMAANELGVLMARYGMRQEARSLFQRSLKVAVSPTTWNNLAIVHDQLGEKELATAARVQAAVLTRRGARPPGSRRPHVEWKEPASFARNGQTQSFPAARIPQRTPR